MLLIHHGRFGSAFSLVRLMFESYVRGVWLLHCASEDQLRKVKCDKLRKSFGTFIHEIEKVDGLGEGILSAVKQKSWKAMNSYTHSGFLQIARRHREETIEPNYDKEEVIEVLNFTNVVALLAAIAVGLMASNEDLANEIVVKANEIFKDEQS